MMNILWLLLAAVAVAFAWLIRRNLSRWRERQRAEEDRFASFMSKAAGTPASSAPPAPVAVPAAVLPDNDLAQQKLLFDAAHKAAEAGEPALAIQLYARLLSRFPATGFAGPARAAVVALRNKVVKS